MANRFYNQFRLSLEKQVVDIFATVNIGGTGAPELEKWVGSPFAANAYASASNGYKGVKSVVRNSAGNYTFTFNDNYQRLLGAHFTVAAASGASPVPMQYYISGTTTLSSTVVDQQQTTGALVKVQFNVTGTAADPADGSRVLCQFTFANSSAQ